MPDTAQTMAAATRGAMRSPSHHHDSSATMAGMAAITTPAATAEVKATPNSMHTEKPKLPSRLAQNISRLSGADKAASPGARRTQCAIASAAMAKRSQASRNTGNTATSKRDKPT